MTSTGRRLLRYALLYKKPIILALIFLTIAVCAELTGPFIAKRMIDQHILGIEKAWYVVPEGTAEAVLYKGEHYLRQDRLAEEEPQQEGARIVQSGRFFYWIDEPVLPEGKVSVHEGIVTVDTTTGLITYEAEQMLPSDVYDFYRPEIRYLLRLSALYLTLIVIGACFTYGMRYLLQYAANRVIQRMRNDVYAHIQRLPVQYFDNLPAGKVVSRVTNDTEAIRELYVAVLSNFFSGVIYITAILGALFIMDARLALVALPLIPMLYVWMIIYRRFAARFNHIIRARISDINGMINEAIQGMSIIQVFRRQKETIREFEELNEEHYVYQNKLLNLNSITSHNLVNVVRNVIFLTVIWAYGGNWLGMAAITVGMLYAFVDYMNRMFQPIVGIVNQFSNLETALVSAERVFELMDEPGVDVEEGDMPRYRGDVRFEQVTFSYKNDEQVLQDISFEVSHGETLALVGHTGSGKSSILNLLFRFYDTDQGRILVGGRDIRSISRQQLRQHMGIVLQDPFLFSGTIASNVSLDHPEITREAIVRALQDVGAYEMLMRLPQGLDEPVLEKGSTLSAGQRQLISFARALVYNPAILILDEATANIDTETEAIIQEAMNVLKRGRTTFIIAHRLSTIRHADQILLLDHGRIVERGDHEQLMKLQGKYSQMVRVQQGAAV
jgi:ATP-binding cassette subfamily B multidrug efflux pump